MVSKPVNVTIDLDRPNRFDFDHNTKISCNNRGQRRNTVGARRLRVSHFGTNIAC